MRSIVWWSLLRRDEQLMMKNVDDVYDLGISESWTDLIGGNINITYSAWLSSVPCTEIRVKM